MGGATPPKGAVRIGVKTQGFVIIGNRFVVLLVTRPGIAAIFVTIGIVWIEPNLLAEFRNRLAVVLLAEISPATLAKQPGLGWIKRDGFIPVANGIGVVTFGFPG